MWLSGGQISPKERDGFPYPREKQTYWGQLEKKIRVTDPFYPCQLKRPSGTAYGNCAQIKAEQKPNGGLFNRYAEHFDLPVHVNEEVREIRKEDDFFLVKT